MIIPEWCENSKKSPHYQGRCEDDDGAEWILFDKFVHPAEVSSNGHHFHMCMEVYGSIPDSDMSLSWMDVIQKCFVVFPLSINSVCMVSV